MNECSPSLDVIPADGPTLAVALVLYGGRADSYERSRARHLSAVRMVPFARAIASRSGCDGVAVATLRYRVRGWNAAEASPVADARWALAEIADRFGAVPIVLVGHSMGGRTALRVADHPRVVAVVGLAPWIPDGEPRVQLGARRLLVVHGTADRWTDPRTSRAYVERAAAEGTPAQFVPLAGHGHFMLRRRARWRRYVTDFVVDVLAPYLGPRAAGSTEAAESEHHGE
ncbi:MAG: alpha/beta hydrolase family protein [Sporichthyaceae bacterium]